MLQLYLFSAAGGFDRSRADLKIGQAPAPGVRRGLAGDGAGEVSVPVVDGGRGGAVYKIQPDGVGADRAAAVVPVEGGGAHALDQAAADQPQDVDLMRTLPVGDAATLPDVELGRPARPRH